LSESGNLEGVRSVVLEADLSIVALRLDCDFVVRTGPQVLGCRPLVLSDSLKTLTARGFGS